MFALVESLSKFCNEDMLPILEVLGVEGNEDI